VPPFYVYADGTQATQLPALVTSNVSLIFSPGFFYQMGNNNNYQMDTSTQLYVRLTFQITNPNNPKGDWYINNTINNTMIRPFEYNYNSAYVTQPGLRDGVMEIAVW
jgi:hypothetical protein